MPIITLFNTPPFKWVILIALKKELEISNSFFLYNQQQYKFLMIKHEFLFLSYFEEFHIFFYVYQLEIN